MSALQLKEVSE